MAHVAVTIISPGQHFRNKGPFSLFLPIPGASHTAPVPAQWHFYPHRVVLCGGSMDPSGTAQIKAATKIQRGDHGGHPGHLLFREIQLVQVTGDDSGSDIPI